MIILLTGGCKNGKSGIGQKLAVLLSKRKKGRLFYVATMRSTGEEDDERIRRHVADREGLGFETLEIGTDIGSLSGMSTGKSGSLSGTYLIDSLTALLANEMFGEEVGRFHTDNTAPKRVADELGTLMDETRKNDADLIFVSDGIYSDSAVYDGDTFWYREGLGELERAVSDCADLVIEMCAGIPVIYKKSDEAAEDKELMDLLKPSGEKQGVLIVGGAAQGKRAFAKAMFELNDDDIYSFDSEEIIGGNVSIPAGYRAYEHVERLALSMSMDVHELADVFPADAVLIVEDITCGIVPMSREDRKWRDDAGRLMQAIGAKREVYRVLCGKGIKIG
ncbi:hypothetical protein D6853_02015 [Butyrivibrio sp. X503]|uniref:bifunctional adenosylcobinamide kinase/adenosylcobinamide-phosphate guanylyltransferase n=1 Tax=Butyrivibrio sp. X503 TaxID=2364878 RepID=UPI000EA9E62F|nr:bifunctional adenosylcobinamide kinase/adenosylcobinamide-phosphate guanylyltransferase [Butyrivibrio sp. X503]RKM58331.1 hypothetical protein D6853_02015 [Butyrivibrio sp. X503]